MTGQALPLDLVSREMRNLNGWFRKYIHEDPNGCWIWHGSRSRAGYGAAWFRGATIGAHRAIYQLMVVDLPRRLDLDHLCRVRACVNPDHLEPVSRSVNLVRGAHPTQGVIGSAGSPQHLRACPTCNASRHERCRTLGAGRPTQMHLARLGPIA